MSLLFLPHTVLAIMYNPGETLDPECSPTDDDCGVLPQITAGANDNITSLSGLTTALSVQQGGTGISSSVLGDLLFSSDDSTFSGLSIGSSHDILQVVDGIPAWGNSLTVSGNFITPNARNYPTTGIQNDVDFGEGSLFRYTGLGDATVTGISGGEDGKQIRIINASASNFILTNDDISSLEVNRILTTSGGNLTIPSQVSVGLQYDGVSNRWRVVVLPATSGTVSSFAFIQNGNAYTAQANLGTTDAFALNFITSGNTRFTVATSSAGFIGKGATTLSSDNTLALASAAGSALTISAGTTGALTLDSGTTGAINLGSGLSSKTVTIGNTVGASTVHIKSGTGGINLTGLVRIGNASTTALSVLNTLAIGALNTSTIVGDNGVSTLHSDLAVTGSTTLHNVVATNVTTTGDLYATRIAGDVQNATLARIGNSTFSTLQDMQNVFHSAGWTSGGEITDGGSGTIDVASGTGLLRPTDSAISTIYYVDWTASTSIEIPVDSLRYVGIEYNAGSPQVTVRTSSNWNYKTDFPLGEVTNENGNIHVANDVQGVGDHASNMIRREYETMPLSRDERNGGLMLMESGDNQRHVMLTSGALWDRLTRYPISEIDSAMDDTFDIYRGTTKQASDQSTWDNTHYSNAGVWTVMDDNKYGVIWFYVETDSHLVAVYGTGQYDTVAAATAEDTPMTIPNRLISNGKLVGRIIFQKSGTVAVQTDSAFSMNQFSNAALTHLSNLSDLDFSSSGLTGFVGTDGVLGGQQIIGGTGIVDGLTLQSTAGAGTTDFIKFLVGNNGATEAGRFTNTGNFGIGTTTPDAKLSVVGDVVANNFTASSVDSTSTFYGGVEISSILNVSGLTTLGSLHVTGSTSLQGLTATNLIFNNATTTNFAVSGNSSLGTVVGGTWNGAAIGPTFGGTNQTNWTKGDILFASGANILSKLPIGGDGTVLTVGGAGVPTWAAAGAGNGGGASQWATSTDDLLIYPSIPTTIVVVGSSATTSLGQDLNAIFEVTGNSLFTGATDVTGLASFSAGVSTTFARVSSSLYVGGNATTSANGDFSTNGVISVNGAGTALSVTNDISVGGLSTLVNILSTGSSTLQDLIVTNVTATNMYATNFSVDTFNPANLSTDGILTVSGQSNLASVSSTGNISVAGAIYVGGFTTTTNGIVNTQTKYQIAGADVLNSNTLGAGIVNSSLTSLGTLGALVVSGHSTFATASTTGNFFVGGVFSVGGFTTTTNGIVNTQTKYQIAGADVLNSNTLGAGVVNSSLTSLGTLGGLVVSGHSTFATASTTGDFSLGGALFVGGNATTSANGNFATNGTITSGLINGQTISASANFTGSLTAAGLLTASNGLTLSAGSLTLPGASVDDAALSTNVALLNRNDQIFSGTNTFSELTTFANAVSTDFSISQNFEASGNFSTPNAGDYATTGIQNDVDFGIGSVFRYTGAGTATFTGVLGGTDGRQIRIINTSASIITLTHQDIASAAENRILISSGVPITISQNGSFTLLYDSSISRWRLVQIPASASIIGTFAFLQNGNAYGAAATLGTTDANALNFITSGNTRFNVASGSATLSGTGATSITSDNTMALSSAAGSALTVTAGTTGALTLDSGSTGNVNIGTGASAKTVTLGNNTGATALNLNSGTGGLTLLTATIGNVSVKSGTTGSVTLDSGSTGTVNLGNGNNAKTINLGTGTAGNTINIGTNNTTLDTISIGSSLDSLSLSSTGLNVTTGGALTGVASIDTIAYSATAMTFAGAGTLSSTGANAMTVDSGTTGDVNIGTGANAKIVTIGNGTGATSLVLNAGTGNIDIGANAVARTINVGTGAAVVETINVGGTGANVIAIGNTQTDGSISLGAAMTGGTISLGGTGLQTGNFDIAPGTGAQTTALANGTGIKTINIGNGVSGNTISVGNGANSGAQIVNVAAGASAANSTVNILSGVATAGTQTLNLGTGASAKTINIGNGTGATTLVLNAGTGNIDIGANAVARTINVGTGAAVVETINVGGTGANVIAIGNTQTAGSISLGAAMTGGTISIGGTGLQTGNLNVAPGTGAQSINIAGGTGVKTINFLATTADATSIINIGSAAHANGNLLSLDDATAAGVCTFNPGAGANWSCTSDGRVKKDVIGLENSLDAILGLRPVKFHMIAEDEMAPLTTGFIAQEFGASIPEGVTMGDDGYFSLDMSRSIPYLVGAIKEQQIFMGDISPKATTSSDNGLSTLIEQIQKENAVDPVLIIGKKISDEKQFLTDFIAARVTAIRGYFDEVFSNKSHQKTLCVGDQNNETCITKAQLDELLSGTKVAPVESQEPVVDAPIEAPVESAPEVAPDTAEPVDAPVESPVESQEPVVDAPIEVPVESPPEVAPDTAEPVASHEVSPE